MTTETRNTAADLERELAEIGGFIAEAAADGDTDEWLRLRMRADALPLYIARRKTGPLRARLERLDAELDGLVAELEATKTGPDPDVPGHVNMAPSAYRATLLTQLVQRQSSVGRERREVLKKIARVEGEAGP